MYRVRRGLRASVTVRGGGASDASYYDTIDSAFTAAHKGDTVTLLADITNRGGDDIFVSGGPYTLDLNGHRIEAGINLVVGDMDNSEALLRGELTVKDSSTDNAGYVQYLKLWNGDLTVESGSFHWIIETGSDSVGTITIKGGTADEVKHTCAGVMFRLSGGTFDYVENIVGGKAGDLLAAGYAYAKKDNPNVIENGYAAGYSAVSNVTVVKHDHTWNDGVCACGVSCAHIEMNSTTGKCSVCGKLLAVASVTKDSTTTYFDDIHAAFGGGGEQQRLHADAASGCDACRWRGHLHPPRQRRLPLHRRLERPYPFRQYLEEPADILGQHKRDPDGQQRSQNRRRLQ